MDQTWLTKSISLKFRYSRSGVVVLTEVLALHDLLHHALLIRRARRGVEALEEFVDVVVAPLAVLLAVGLVHGRDVLLEARHLVRVGGKPVVRGVVFGQVPLEPFVGQGGAAHDRTRERDVAVAPGEERAVTQHAEVDVDGADQPDHRLVVHRPVVDVGERGLDQERRTLVPRADDLAGHEHVVPDDAVVLRVGPRADRGVDLRRRGGRGAHGGIGEEGALGDQGLQVGPRRGMGLQHVHAARVPDHGHDELGRLALIGRQERLGHRRAVGGVEAIELQQFGGRGSHIGGGDRPLHLALGLDVARAVPEHRHGLDVVPGAHVRQSRAHEVRLFRDEGDLRSPVRTPAPVGAKQLLMGDGTRQPNDVLVARLGLRGDRSPGGEGAGGQEEEQDSDEDTPTVGVGGHGEIGNTTPGGTTTQAVAWSGADRQPPHDAPGGARAGGPSRCGLARVLRRQEL